MPQSHRSEDNTRPEDLPVRSPFSGRGWKIKFENAFRGLIEGLLDRGNRWQQNSFLIHGPASIAVLAVARFQGLDRISMAILILCIAMVWVAELFNSAVESLAKAVTDQPNPWVKRSLDIASGAVLLASGFAVAIGLLLLM